MSGRAPAQRAPADAACPALALSVEIKGVLDAILAVDEAEGGADADRKVRLRQLSEVLDERLAFLVARLSQTQARSLEGAMLQVAVAGGELDELLGYVDQRDRAQCDEVARRIVRHLYSIMSVLRDMAGHRLDDRLAGYGGAGSAGARQRLNMGSPSPGCALCARTAPRHELISRTAS